jgi:hypothetical protein
MATESSARRDKLWLPADGHQQPDNLAGIDLSGGPLSAELATNRTHGPSAHPQRAQAPLASVRSALPWLIVGTIALALILMI